MPSEDFGLGSWWDIYRKGRDGKPKGKGGGGGPKAKVRFGKQTARGRLYPVPPRPKSVIVKNKFFKADRWTDKRVRAWINYCAKGRVQESTPQTSLERNQDEPKLDHEPLKENSIKHEEITKRALPGEKAVSPLPDYISRDPVFFNGQRDGIHPDEAAKIILDNVGKSVSHHTLVLSNGDPKIDLKDYTREQMKVLQEALGHKITWVANVNRDTGPNKEHVHVTIAGRIAEFTEPKRNHEREHQNREYDSKDIDLKRVSPEDTVRNPAGPAVTKFHSTKELLEFDEFCKDDHYIDKEDYRKLWSWIGTKEQHGENTYGTPPLKERDDDRREQSTGSKNGHDARAENANESAKASRSDETGAPLPSDIAAANRDQTGKLHEQLREGRDPVTELPTIMKPAAPERVNDLSAIREPLVPETKQIDYERIPARDKVETSHAPITKYSPVADITKAIHERVAIASAIDQLRYWREENARSSKTEGAEHQSTKNEKLNAQAKPEKKVQIGDQVLTKDSNRDALDAAWQELKPQREEISKLERWQRDKLLLGEDWYGEPPTKERAEPTQNPVDRPQPEPKAEHIKSPEQAKETTPQKSLDEVAHELTGGKTISVSAVKLDAALKRYDKISPEKQKERKDSANQRGDVFITRDAIALMREHGNYYVHCMRNLDRVIDQEIQREHSERVHIREKHPRDQEARIEKLVKKRESIEKKGPKQIQDRPALQYRARESNQKLEQLLANTRANRNTHEEQAKAQKGQAPDVVTQSNSWKRLDVNIWSIGPVQTFLGGSVVKRTLEGQYSYTVPAHMYESEKAKYPTKPTYERAPGPGQSFAVKSDAERLASRKPRDHKGRLR